MNVRYSLCESIQLSGGQVLWPWTRCGSAPPLNWPNEFDSHNSDSNILMMMMMMMTTTTTMTFVSVTVNTRQYLRQHLDMCEWIITLRMTDQCWRWWWWWWWWRCCWWCESTAWRLTTTTTWRPDTWHDDRNVFIKSRHRRDVTRMTYWRHTSRSSRMRI